MQHHHHNHCRHAKSASPFGKAPAISNNDSTPLTNVDSDAVCTSSSSSDNGEGSRRCGLRCAPRRTEVVFSNNARSSQSDDLSPNSALAADPLPENLEKEAPPDSERLQLGVPSSRPQESAAEGQQSQGGDEGSDSAVASQSTPSETTPDLTADEIGPDVGGHTLERRENFCIRVHDSRAETPNLLADESSGSSSADDLDAVSRAPSRSRERQHPFHSSCLHPRCAAASVEPERPPPLRHWAPLDPKLIGANWWSPYTQSNNRISEGGARGGGEQRGRQHSSHSLRTSYEEFFCSRRLVEAKRVDSGEEQQRVFLSSTTQDAATLNETDVEEVSSSDRDTTAACTTPICRSVLARKPLAFQWDVSDFNALRYVTVLRGLPLQDRILSPTFGNDECGLWQLALFPYRDWKTGKNVSLYLFCDPREKRRRIAEFKMYLLDSAQREMPGTLMEEVPRVFTPSGTAGSSEGGAGRGSSSWGWKDFLHVANEEELQQYLSTDGRDTLSIKVELLVYLGVDQIAGPRHVLESEEALFHHVQTQESRKRLLEAEVFNAKSSHEREPKSTANHHDPTEGFSSTSGNTKLTSGGDTRQRGALDPKEWTLTQQPPRLLPLSGGTSTLRDDLSSFLKTVPAARDVRILCAGGEVAYGCSTVLAARSCVFRALLYSHMKTSNNNSGSSHHHHNRIMGSGNHVTLDLPDITVETVREFLTFLETDTCPSLQELHKRRHCRPPLPPSPEHLAQANPPGRPLPTKPSDGVGARRQGPRGVKCRLVELSLRLTSLLRLSDYYQVESLYFATVKALLNCLTPKTVRSILAVAEDLQCGVLLRAAEYYLQRLPPDCELPMIPPRLARLRGRSSHIREHSGTPSRRGRQHPVSADRGGSHRWRL